ncbi:hypothetical protein LT493_04825 [Streptomyces tricolor]|nr:hypothetical protein [Streptomyces tricolor]
MLEGSGHLGEPDPDELDFLEDLGRTGGSTAWPASAGCGATRPSASPTTSEHDPLAPQRPSVHQKGDLMPNRVTNAGYGDRTPFLTTTASAALRAEIDKQLDQQVLGGTPTSPRPPTWRAERRLRVLAAAPDQETTWRIRLLRVAEAKALV